MYLHSINTNPRLKPNQITLMSLFTFAMVKSVYQLVKYVCLPFNNLPLELHVILYITHNS